MLQHLVRKTKSGFRFGWFYSCMDGSQISFHQVDCEVQRNTLYSWNQTVCLLAWLWLWKRCKNKDGLRWVMRVKLKFKEVNAICFWPPGYVSYNSLWKHIEQQMSAQREITANPPLRDWKNKAQRLLLARWREPTKNAFITVEKWSQCSEEAGATVAKAALLSTGVHMSWLIREELGNISASAKDGDAKPQVFCLTYLTGIAVSN